MFKFFLITILTTSTILDISCQSKRSKDIPRPTIDSNVSNTMRDTQIIDTGSLKKEEITPKEIRNVKVLSMNKENKEDSLSEDYNKCRLWSITSKQFESIIKKFVPMTSEEQNLSYSFYKCRFSGEIKIDDIKYKYWLGAGGTLTLKNNGTTLYYGCLGKNCREYFISGKLTEKDYK